MSCNLSALQECLELFLEVLPAYYPSLYSVEGVGNERIVTITFPEGTQKVYTVADFEACPLELCGRLVQVWGVLVIFRWIDGTKQTQTKTPTSSTVIWFAMDALTDFGSALLAPLSRPQC
jgi:hypothetical protein